MSATSFLKPSHQELSQLLDVARKAICSIFSCERMLPPELSHYDDHLIRRGACFVTLEVNGVLQGCIGSVSPREPLVLDVYEKACASALQNQRLMPLTSDKLAGLTIEVSVLNPPEMLKVSSEAALISHLESIPAGERPGIIMADFLSGQPRQAIFLPQIWVHLPEPENFVRQLKCQAGWEEGYWSPAMAVKTFTVCSIKETFG